MRISRYFAAGLFIMSEDDGISNSYASASESERDSESEADAEEVAADKKRRNLPEGAPRIASGALMEGGDDEEWRLAWSLCSCSLITTLTVLKTE